MSTSTQAVPLDVRLMQRAAAVCFGLFGTMLAVLGLSWASEHPVFALRGITVVGDVTHNNAITVRANVAARLRGTFFSIDLLQVRQAFEALPWVRKAIVHREFPNRIKVQLQEHRAVAYWGHEGESRLVNSYGEVFEANLGEVEQDALPRLLGPQGQSAAVLAMYQTVQPLFAGMDLSLDQLELSGQGSWRAQLETGALVELGSGTAQDVLARTQRFLKTLTQVTSFHGRTPQVLDSADLRHVDGYAVRLRGVTTLSAPAH